MSMFLSARPVWVLRLLLALAALNFSVAANAQGYLDRLLDDFNEVKALSQRKQRFEFENDVIFKTDRNYTDGVRYGYKYLGLRQYRKSADAGESFLPGFNLDPVSSQECTGGKLCYYKSYTLYLGHSMYTPSDIRLKADQIPPGERPYAAWVYFGFYRELFASDGRYWRYGLDLGCRLSSTAISPIPPFPRDGARRSTTNSVWCSATSTFPAPGSRRHFSS